MSAPTTTSSVPTIPIAPVPLPAPAEWSAAPEAETSRLKLYAILGTLAGLILFGLLTWGLYTLGGEDQSALERFRDISIIFIVASTVVIVILLAGITAALAYLILAIRDEVIPMLGDVNETTRRISGTTQFLTEEAVKPIVGVAGAVAKVRAMGKAVVQGVTRR